MTTDVAGLIARLALVAKDSGPIVAALLREAAALIESLKRELAERDAMCEQWSRTYAAAEAEVARLRGVLLLARGRLLLANHEAKVDDIDAALASPAAQAAQPEKEK